MTPNGVVLITVLDGKELRDSGTGFVVEISQKGALVVTCAHVLGPSAKQNLKIFVNEMEGKVLGSENETGVDLALIEVPRLRDANPVKLSRQRGRSRGFHYAGFSPFSRGEFVRELVKGRISGESHVLAPQFGLEMLYLKMAVSKNGLPLKKGHSGAPIFDGRTGRVFAVARLKETDGRTGYAIDIRALGHLRSDLIEEPIGKIAPRGVPEKGPKPPAPLAIIHSDDPQKGRWGKKRERQGRKLSIQNLVQQNRWFYFDAVVESTDGSELVGPVLFHLHDSYPRQVIYINKIRGGKQAILEEISAIGVSTIGVQVKAKSGKWTSLEYDLKVVPGLASRFKSR